MKTFVINGRFTTDRINGIVRYATEITKEIDNVVKDDIRIILLVPINNSKVPLLNNIEVVRYGNFDGIAWEQIYLRHYLIKHKDYVCINFCNVTPFFVQPGITVIHDIMYKVNPQDYRSFRNHISRLWHMVQYSYISKHEQKILTVSNYSKKDIELNYPKSKGKIEILYPAWTHIRKIKPSEDWKRKYPFLQKNNYFFSISTLGRNKNGKWIIEEAKKNSQYQFAMAGKMYESDFDEIPQNVHLLGFISDEDASALMQNAAAFLFPSFYEGFGLPPLEALAQGVKVICSNTTSMPEVLGDSVYYIDPAVTTYDFDDLLKNHVGNSNIVLEKYSWKKSAIRLLNILKDIK